MHFFPSFVIIDENWRNEMNVILIIYFVLSSFLGYERNWEFNHGVIDRMEDDKAVIILEDLQSEISVPIVNIPSDMEEHDWLIIFQQKDRFHVLSVDYVKTEVEREKSLLLIEKLRD